MNVKNIVRIVLVVLGGILIYFSAQNTWADGREKLENFEKSLISGKLKYLSLSGGFAHIILEGEETKYSFMPKEVLPEEQTFSRFAKRGDSIYKESFSDTLYIVKSEGKMMPFTYHKY